MKSKDTNKIAEELHKEGHKRGMVEDFSIFQNS